MRLTFALPADAYPNLDFDSVLGKPVRLRVPFSQEKDEDIQVGKVVGASVSDDESWYHIECEVQKLKALEGVIGPYSFECKVEDKWVL